jgi:hypothetical protein
MSPGTQRRARSRAGFTLSGSRVRGGSTFAEDPRCPAPRATIIWDAALDPGVLTVYADAAAGSARADSIDPRSLAPWLSIARDEYGVEHAVLSDGRRRVRLDVIGGSMTGHEPVVLRYALSGLVSVERRLAPLQQLIHFCRFNRFAWPWGAELAGIERMILLLRINDALREGASQRDMAQTLYGDRIGHDWRETADSLRSRVRRLVRDARALAAGGYRRLMRRAAGEP